jgi:hypothetical protein
MYAEYMFLSCDGQCVDTGLSIVDMVCVCKVHWVSYTGVHWVDAKCDVCMLECEGGTSVGLPSLRSGRVFQESLLTEARPLSERKGHMARSPVQGF